MGFLTDWLTDWLKELLIEGIMGNLTGLFDTVNSRVGEIAVQVGTTPAAWNAGAWLSAGAVAAIPAHSCDYVGDQYCVLRHRLWPHDRDISADQLSPYPRGHAL